MRKSAQSHNRLKLFAVGLTAAIAFLGFYSGSSRTFRATASSSGPSASHTGAPGEQNCTTCHSDFIVNSGEGNVRVLGLPANYTPGASYPVTVRVNQPNGVIFGFQTVALDGQNLQAGDYTLPAQSPAQMQIKQGLVSGNQRRYVEHTSAGTAPAPGTFETKSWTFNWTAPTTRKGRVTFYAAGNGADSDGSTSGDYIYTTSASICSGSVGSNFDGDRRADVSVFRPSTGLWYRINSSNSQTAAVQFGTSGDRIVPGDFDGDGKNDIAVWRPSTGVWYIQRSSDNSVVAYFFGSNGDVPLVGDYTGDGKSDLVIWRPATGIWYTLNLTNNASTAVKWGANGDKPVSGDYDGDGKNDLAVYRPASGGGFWYVLRSSDNSVYTVQFGVSTDKPVSGDFDGDGKTDISVFRSSNGTWYRINSGNSQATAVQWGIDGDQPAPTDYDGDCKTDLAVYRNGIWYILNSSNNSVTTLNFGLAGDVPIASVYTAQ